MVVIAKLGLPLLLSLVAAQTPIGFSVATDETIRVIGEPGNVTITTNKLVAQRDVFFSPTIYLPMDENSDDLYLAILIDPDANYFLHWMQPNLVADSIGNLTFSTTATGASAAVGAGYIYPQPPEGPPHTYVHLLYRQPSDWRFPGNYSTINPPKDVYARINFTINDFEVAASLSDTLVGANYYRVLNGTAQESSAYATKTGGSTKTSIGSSSGIVTHAGSTSTSGTATASENPVAMETATNMAAEMLKAGMSITVIAVTFALVLV